jgi:hypothetical protein
MDEERHRGYVVLDLGENDEFHFLRMATLRVFRSGAVERWCETCDGDTWISDL